MYIRPWFLKSRLVSHVLNLDPYFGLFSLSVLQNVLVQHPRTDTCSFGKHWGENEHIASVHVPLVTGTKVSLSPRILASAGNLVSYVRAYGNGNMSSILTS